MQRNIIRSNGCLPEPAARLTDCGRPKGLFRYKPSIFLLECTHRASFSGFKFWSITPPRESFLLLAIPVKVVEVFLPLFDGLGFDP